MQPQSLGAETTQRPRRRFVFTNISSPDKIVDLEAGQRWALKGRRRVQTVLCLKGSIWVTQEGDFQDYVLEEGDAFLVTRPGLVLVRALKPACIGYCDGFDSSPHRKWFKETVLN